MKQAEGQIIWIHKKNSSALGIKFWKIGPSRSWKLFIYTSTYYYIFALKLARSCGLFWSGLTERRQLSVLGKSRDLSLCDTHSRTSLHFPVSAFHNSQSCSTTLLIICLFVSLNMHS